MSEPLIFYVKEYVDSLIFRHTVDVCNTDSTPKEYKLQHVPALTALTMKEVSSHLHQEFQQH